MFKKILEYGYNAAMIFIFAFANLLLLTSLLFLINVSISVLHLPISFIVAVIEVYFLRKTDIKDISISVIIPMMVTLIIKKLSAI